MKLFITLTKQIELTNGVTLPVGKRLEVYGRGGHVARRMLICWVGEGRGVNDTCEIHRSEYFKLEEAE